MITMTVTRMNTNLSAHDDENSRAWTDIIDVTSLFFTTSDTCAFLLLFISKSVCIFNVNRPCHKILL